MSYTVNTNDPHARFQRVKTGLADYVAFAAFIEAELADPVDLRPAGDQVKRDHDRAIGAPAMFRRFDRATYEEIRDQVRRELEIAYQAVCGSALPR